MTDEPTPAPAIRVVAGSPSAEELAAVTAVLAGLEAERAARSVERHEATGPSAWARSRRALRGPVNPGPGRWREGTA